MRAGERFEALYGEHAGAVRAYALRRTSAANADDVVAEVFLVAWRRLEDAPAEPRAWLFGVARRVLANHRRALARGDALRSRIAEEPRAPQAGSPAGDQLVLDALTSLSEPDREALLLVAWEELSHREAARVLGVRETTFSVRVHRARRRFARALRATGAAPGTNPIEPMEAQ